MGRYFFYFYTNLIRNIIVKRKKKAILKYLCGGELIWSRWNILHLCEIHKLDQLEF